MKAYDAKKISVIINGVPIKGLANDPAITIKYTEPRYTVSSDLYGEQVTRWKNQNNQVEISIFLTTESSGNDIMSSFLALDTQKDAGAFAITINDKNSTNSLFVSTEAFISEPPQVTLGGQSQVREWKILASKMDPFTIGGI